MVEPKGIDDVGPGGVDYSLVTRTFYSAPV
jgi:hypothetical protein